MCKLILTLFLIFSFPLSAETFQPIIGVIAAESKPVQVNSKTLEGKVVTRSVQLGQHIYLNDEISTDADNKVQILLKDQTVFSIGANSLIVVDKFVFDPNKPELTANIKQGAFKFVSGKISEMKKDAMKVNMPKSVIAVRGTSVAGSINPDGSSIVVLLHGAISLGNSANNTVDITKPGYGSQINPNGGISTPLPFSDSVIKSITSNVAISENSSLKDSKTQESAIAKNVSSDKKTQDNNTINTSSADTKTKDTSATKISGDDGKTVNIATSSSAVSDTKTNDTATTKVSSDDAKNANIATTSLAVSDNKTLNVSGTKNSNQETKKLNYVLSNSTSNNSSATKTVASTEQPTNIVDTITKPSVTSKETIASALTTKNYYKAFYPSYFEAGEFDASIKQASILSQFNTFITNLSSGAYRGLTLKSAVDIQALSRGTPPTCRGGACIFEVSNKALNLGIGAGTGGGTIVSHGVALNFSTSTLTNVYNLNYTYGGEGSSISNQTVTLSGMASSSFSSLTAESTNIIRLPVDPSHTQLHMLASLYDDAKAMSMVFKTSIIQPIGDTINLNLESTNSNYYATAYH